MTASSSLVGGPLRLCANQGVRSVLSRIGFTQLPGDLPGTIEQGGRYSGALLPDRDIVDP